MNIIIFGAGAIGSLFGALLSKNNSVLLFGRKNHIDSIKINGLEIKGKTNLNVKIKAESSIDNVTFSPDLLILTVKSYDTETAIKKVINIINNDTKILSLQNGLNNIEKISKFIDSERIIVGTTTHGAIFSEPGIIKHTGTGNTIIGELKKGKIKQLNNVIKIFNEAGIKTEGSKNVINDIWIKAVINSSINPLTAIFRCKNGHLSENPILEKLLEMTCKESVKIANSEGIDISYLDMIQKTKEVVKNTSENYSSMLQSVINKKRTEIDSINGKLIEIGKKNKVSTIINEILVNSVISS
jgi:2-dehydropantoate 2-reductase